MLNKVDIAEFIASEATDDHVDGIQMKLTRRQKEILVAMRARQQEALSTFVRRALIAYLGIFLDQDG
jgi:hypothetical protein